MKKLLSSLALLIVLWALNLHADSSKELLEKCAEQLSSESALSGKFTQEKRVEFLEQPIVSSGVFSVWNSGNLDWRVESPVESLMEVRGTNVMLDGERVRGYGMGRLMSMITSGFMQGDFTGVTHHFDVEGKVEESGWALTLHARSGRMKSAVTKIEIEGARYLQSLRIYETGGGETLIRFENVHPTNIHERQQQ